MMKGLAAAYCRMRLEHGLANGNQVILHDQAVAALDLVARIGAQRFSDEMPIGDLHDGVGRLLRIAIGDGRAETLHEQRDSAFVDAPDGMDSEGDLQVVAAQHRMFPDELFGVGVGRDADVRDVEQPSAAGRRGASLDCRKSGSDRRPLPW